MHFHHCDIPCHLAPFVKLYRDTFSLCGLVRSFIVYGTSIVDRHRTCFLVCVCACRSKRTLIATLFEAQPILLLSLSAASWEQTFCIVRAKQTMFTDTNDLWCTCTCCNGFSAPVLLFSLFFVFLPVAPCFNHSLALFILAGCLHRFCYTYIQTTTSMCLQGTNAVHVRMWSDALYRRLERVRCKGKKVYAQKYCAEINLMVINQSRFWLTRYGNVWMQMCENWTLPCNDAFM